MLHGWVPFCGCPCRDASSTTDCDVMLLISPISLLIIIPTTIRWINISGQFPMGMGIPPLHVDFMFESNPLKYRIWVRRLALWLRRFSFTIAKQATATNNQNDQWCCLRESEASKRFMFVGSWFNSCRYHWYGLFTAFPRSCFPRHRCVCVCASIYGQYLYWYVGFQRVWIKRN